MNKYNKNGWCDGVWVYDKKTYLSVCKYDNGIIIGSRIFFEKLGKEISYFYYSNTGIIEGEHLKLECGDTFFDLLIKKETNYLN